VKELALLDHQIGVDSVVEAFSYLAQGSCPHLHWLRVFTPSNTGQVVQALVAALQSGHMANLENLELISFDSPLSSFSPIPLALADGVCRNLKSLTMAYSTFVAERDAVITAITSGAIPLLEKPELGWRLVEQDGSFSVPLVESSQGRHCPNMKTLDFAIKGQGLIAFAHALHCGLFSRLKALFHGHSLPVLQPVRDGSCPDLRHLTIAEGVPSVTREHAHVLGEALASKVLIKLETLQLLSWFGNNEWLLEVMEGLRGGEHCRLNSLIIRGCDFGPRAATALTEAITSIPLRHLKYLELNDNEVIGDDGMACVLKALATTCPLLKALDISCTGWGGKSGDALIDAIGHGAWPDLTILTAYGNDFGRTKHDAQRLQHLFQEGACPKLTRINVGDDHRKMIEAAFKSRWRRVHVS